MMQVSRLYGRGAACQAHHEGSKIEMLKQVLPKSSSLKHPEHMVVEGRQCGIYGNLQREVQIPGLCMVHAVSSTLGSFRTGVTGLMKRRGNPSWKYRHD